MKYTFSLFAILLFCTNLFAQTSAVVRIDNPSSSSIDYIKSNKLEITSFKQGEYIDLMLPPEWTKNLTLKGIPFTVTQTHEQNIRNLMGDKDISGYRTYDDVLQELEQIVIDYPEICSLSDIGDSKGKIYFQNGNDVYQDYQHDLWMLKISDNVSESEDEPAVYFVGAHHAREPISTEVVMGIINHLLNAYGIDDEITNMINESEIYIVPIVNPDGHKVVLDQLNTNWRKNASDNNEDGLFEYYDYSPDGVDANRNYGWEWGGAGSSGDPTEWTYRGTSAFSEPEVEAIKDLMASHQFVSGISYHSYSELVLWPFAYSDAALAPDHEAMEELGVSMAATIPRISGSGTYTPEQSNDLYPASGVTEDWAYGEHGIFSMLIELAQQFIPPASQVPDIVSDNIESAMILLNRVNHQTLRGHVYDAETLEPVIAEVYINGVDDIADFRKPYKSNPIFGSYYRLLTSGTKTVTFSAYGYISQTFDDVEIVNDEPTLLDVYLEKAANGPVFGSIIDGVSGENIEGAEITFINTPLPPAISNENGVYEFDEVAYNSYQVKVKKEGYSSIVLNTDVSEEQYIINFVMLPSETISFEDGDIPEDFGFSGNLPWLIDETESNTGIYSSVSGNITDSQSSTMTLEIEDTMEGVFKFYKKVSSESGWDFLKFYIDNQEQAAWSGEDNWSEANFDISQGAHQFKWTYIKDSNTSSGADKAWVDDIGLPAASIVMVNAGPDQEICHDAQAMLNAYAANYETLSWTSSGDGSFSDINNPNCMYTPGVADIENGFVTLQVNASGNTGSVNDEMVLHIQMCLGLEEFEANNFTISPNPASDLINISFESNELKRLEIYHISGQLIKNIQLAPHQELLQLNAKQFGSGVYILKMINTNGWSVVKRLIVE